MTRPALLLSFTTAAVALILGGTPGEARGDWYDISLRIGGSGSDHRYSVSLEAGSTGRGSRGQYSLSINLGSSDYRDRDYRGPGPYGPPPASYLPYSPYGYVPLGYARPPYGPRVVVVDPRGPRYGAPYGVGAFMRHDARRSGPRFGYVEARDDWCREADSWRPYDLPGRR